MPAGKLLVETRILLRIPHQNRLTGRHHKARQALVQRNRSPDQVLAPDPVSNFEEDLLPGHIYQGNRSSRRAKNLRCRVDNRLQEFLVLADQYRSPGCLQGVQQMDGYQFLEAIAADRPLRDIPVIVTSWLDGVARCINMGAEDYLTKPPNPVLLRARINASLEKKRLRDQQKELIRKFAASEVADDLRARGFSLGGQAIKATVLFSNIRSFTAVQPPSTSRRYASVLESPPDRWSPAIPAPCSAPPTPVSATQSTWPPAWKGTQKVRAAQS